MIVNIYLGFNEKHENYDYVVQSYAIRTYTFLLSLKYAKALFMQLFGFYFVLNYTVLNLILLFLYFFL